ncbi:hypothetical protein G7Y89_g7403 [Cudoniella acicularis]|uniref:Uncharacterized protein n=1 Tax=Cudoniella acicularis TaxID=354080 RepID=A0A8H4W3U9_9HELO|nr:hypothetical protein G7Y89_g7403 [Cudoniella acicularis]
MGNGGKKTIRVTTSITTELHSITFVPADDPNPEVLCFRSLPADLSQHYMLCDTYHFLHVNVLGGQSINEIFSDLKSGQSDYDREERREIKGNKSKARDTAFKLLYSIPLGDFKDETKDSAKVFNAVLYLVSYAATFK